MGYLSINKVTYSGDKFFYISPEFGNGVNIIEGENGNGKSTLINLIYYCLGGDVKKFNMSSANTGKHKQIADDTNQYIELDLTLSDVRYIIRRSIGKNYVSISDSSGGVETFSINRTENPTIFSDWILEKLDIKILDIYQGVKSFKLNIKDLFRLIYHDQNPDPKKVFKSPDVESFVADSEYVRKLIFRVLLGKSFEEYYNIIGVLRNAENERNIAQSLMKEFEMISSQMYSNESDVLNVNYLREKIAELKDQKQKLSSTRELLKIDRPTENESAWLEIENIKTEILQLELLMQSKNDQLNNFHQELYKYDKYRDGLIKEVTQLNKIIHTHDTLEVFSPDSCPFCLGVLDREMGKCYCGNPIEEETFEKFFFSSEEYWDLLKSRKKSVETVDLVIKSVNEKIDLLKKEVASNTYKSDELKSTLNTQLNKIDHLNIDVDKINQIDDKSFEIKNAIQNLEKKLDFEAKLVEYKESFEAKNSKVKELQRETKILEINSNKEMDLIVSEFNVIYNTLMTNTLKECRSAKIDSESYEPIVDGGLYREASSRVSIRFNYYLAILIMSIRHDSVKFPKFLLIDTPRTAGIDLVELKKLLAQLISIKDKKFQIILTTGHGAYPDELKSNVKETLTDENKLLKQK